MLYKVNKGVVKHKGAFFRQGSFFDASPNEVKRLVTKGIISAVSGQPDVFTSEPEIDDSDHIDSGVDKTSSNNDVDADDDNLDSAEIPGFPVDGVIDDVIIEADPSTISDPKPKSGRKGKGK